MPFLYQPKAPAPLGDDIPCQHPLKPDAHTGRATLEWNWNLQGSVWMCPVCHKGWKWVKRTDNGAYGWGVYLKEIQIRWYHKERKLLK